MNFRPEGTRTPRGSTHRVEALPPTFEKNSRVPERFELEIASPEAFETVGNILDELLLFQNIPDESYNPGTYRKCRPLLEERPEPTSTDPGSKPCMPGLKSKFCQNKAIMIVQCEMARTGVT